MKETISYTVSVEQILDVSKNVTIQIDRKAWEQAKANGTTSELLAEKINVQAFEKTLDFTADHGWTLDAATGLRVDAVELDGSYTPEWIVEDIDIDFESTEEEV